MAGSTLGGGRGVGYEDGESMQDQCQDSTGRMGSYARLLLYPYKHTTYVGPLLAKIILVTEKQKNDKGV